MELSGSARIYGNSGSAGGLAVLQDWPECATSARVTDPLQVAVRLSGSASISRNTARLAGGGVAVIRSPYFPYGGSSDSSSTSGSGDGADGDSADDTSSYDGSGSNSDGGLAGGSGGGSSSRRMLAAVNLQVKLLVQLSGLASVSSNTGE